MFSFQEFKQLSTGDGAMLTVRDPALADKMENVWAFSGESPTLMTLNWRMNEMTAAVGLAQLQRVDRIVKEYYNVTLGILNDAIKGCQWLKPRLVPAEAVQAGYWFACTWQGDKFGLDYQRFKNLSEKHKVGLRFGFNQTAPYEFDFFKKGDIYGYGCPYKCPFFLKNSTYKYKRGLCPNVEDLMPRLITVNLIFLPIDEAKRTAEKLHKVIAAMDKG
jgi:dTDP-4-amino-4,6-dideoxygalactose transaminase